MSMRLAELLEPADERRRFLLGYVGAVQTHKEPGGIISMSPLPKSFSEPTWSRMVRESMSLELAVERRTLLGERKRATL